MKRTKIITKDRILKTMVYIPLTLIAWFINWVLEKILNNVTDKIASLKINSLMELIEKIAPYAFMIFVSIGIIIWIYWILKDRFKYKKLYYVLTPVTNITIKRNILIPPFCVVDLLQNPKGCVFS